MRRRYRAGRVRSSPAAASCSEHPSRTQRTGAPLCASARLGRPARMPAHRFFWGQKPRTPGVIDKACLSQWWPARFVVDDVAYTSAEQWMMAEKARLMGDASTRAKILATDDPATVKALGREVTPYDETLWVAQRLDVVTRGSIAKLDQNAELKAFLLSTGDDVLVEASPKDTVWGIGLAENDPRAGDPAQWRGENLLGQALMRARAALR